MSYVVRTKVGCCFAVACCSPTYPLPWCSCWCRTLSFALALGALLGFQLAATSTEFVAWHVIIVVQRRCYVPIKQLLLLVGVPGGCFGLRFQCGLRVQGVRRFGTQVVALAATACDTYRSLL